MTPYEIEIIIHHNGSAAKFSRSDAPLYQPTVNGFIEDGILTSYGDGTYRTTDRGRAFVAMLCATPLPEQKWFDPRTKELI